MNLQRIDHVAINVKELQRSFDWYNKVFRFEIIHKWTNTWMIGNTAIKIGMFERPSASYVTNIDRNIYAIGHFAFLVEEEDFKSVLKEIDNLQIPHEPVEDTGIAYSFFLNE